jgi:hypothetical protein
MPCEDIERDAPSALGAVAFGPFAQTVFRGLHLRSRGGWCSYSEVSAVIHDAGSVSREQMLLLRNPSQ